MAITIIDAFDLGDDVLRVRGTVDGHVDPETGAPIVVEALGWVSALGNHFDASSLDAAGQRKDGVAGRAMTKAEQRQYCKGLIRDALPEDARRREKRAPVDLGIAG